jgi:hypothetical protein
MLILVLLSLIFMYLLPGIPVYAAGALVLMVAITGLLMAFEIGKFIPVPFSVKKFILINIILRLYLVLAGMFKIDKEKIMQYFIYINNINNPKFRKGTKILLLLPRCLQHSSCSQELSEDIKNCVGCGKCQIAEIVKNTGFKK